MAKNKDPKALASFLKCLSVLESNVFVLYKNLGDKVELPLAKSLLFTLASDSQKHSVILSGVGDGIAKVSVKAKDCDKKLGEIWQVSDNLYREILSKEKFVEEELPQLAERLGVMESALGEEYYVFVQIQTLSLMTKEINQLYNIEIDDLKRIFENVIADEERHREILATIRKLLRQREKKLENATPFVKYTNPDSWITPSFSRE